MFINNKMILILTMEKRVMIPQLNMEKVSVS